MSLRPLRQLLLTTLFTVLCTATSQAQLTNVTNATATPTAGVGHDYFKLLDETVDPSSGAVSVRIGVPVPPSRGLTIPFAFTYDSNSYSLQLLQPGQMIWNFNQNLLAYGPWSNTLPTLSAVLVQYQQPGSQPNPCYAGTGYLFQDPSGGRHALGISAIFSSNATPSCSGTHWQNAFTGGDDFFRAAISGVSPTQGANISTSGPGAGEVRIADASGTVYDFAKSTPSNFNSWNCSTNGIQTNTFASAMPTKIEDRNGNVIAISQPCAGSTFAISDTAGRTALSFSATNHTLPSGLQSWKITSATPSGSSLPYQASWTTATSTKPSLNATTVQGPQGCTGVPAWASFQQGVSPDLVSSITLPNGKQYQFTYDPVYGLLSKITYPTGGYVSYSWGLNPQSASATYTTGVPISTCVYIYDRPAVLHRYVSFDGTTIALQQDFSYSTTWSFNVWATKQTTVTTHDLVRGTTFQTVYAYTPVDAPSVPNSRPIISGSQATETFADRQIAVESTVTYQNINGSVLATVTKAWQDQYEMWCEIKTLDNGSYSGTTFGYGPGHVVTDKKEWDFGVLASPNCSSTVQTPPTPTRETVSTYQSFAATPIYSAGPSIFDKPATVITYGNGTRLAETDFSYDQSTVGTVTNLPAGTHDETNYAAASTVPRGNATTVTKQCFQGATACTNSVSTSTFDETGQTLTKVDPCGNSTCADMTGTTHTTTFSYADSFDSPPASNTNAYLTQVTDPLGHTHSFKYAFADGQLISSTDQNNLTTQFLYGDSMRRITETDFPDGGKTTVSYNDAAPTPSVTTSKSINALQSITSVSVSDGIGHPVQSQLTSDPQGTVFIDTAYDGLGRVKSVSNPYRMGSDPTTTTGTTSFVYDSLGRKTSETAQDGSIIATAYCGPNTLATDPTGRWRRSRSDALGHLVEVDEPNAVGATVAATGCPGTGEPIWVTSYSYDALNDLLQVLQNGSHQRTFTYDSLSRMLTSTNPEVGTLTYTYDPNGNVSSKKDARNITTSYTYDVLNRNLTTAYSNGDAGVSIVYDQTNCLGLAACQNIGQRTSMTDAAGSEAWSYQVDATNKRTVHVNQRTTSGVTKNSTYYLDLAANLTSVVYPTGRTVNYTYDNARRPITAADSANGITYATSPATPLSGCLANAVCYTPQGSIYSTNIGKTSTFTGLNFSETFNNRLQPNELKATSTGGSAMDISYNFVDPVSGKNAGHVYGITNNLDTTRSQSFTYDQLNRIVTAQSTSTFSTSPAHCWGESYTLDAWANLNAIAATANSAYSGCTEESGFSQTATANNQLPGFGYDASGNTAGDGTITYAWDGESQMKSATNGGTTTNYVYDGSGRRVSKSSGKLYWYGSGGEILAETNASGTTTAEYIFFGGKRIAMLPAGNTAQFYAEDILGSSRVVTTNTGVVCYDADFYPYGGERTVTNTCTQNAYKFEGKERDTETGNDDFGARYYSNRFGRWLSADWSNVPVPIPYANLTNPQTLNLYAMVSDDPESFADLDGHLLRFGSPSTATLEELCVHANWNCLPDAANYYNNSTAAQQAAQQQQNQTAQQAQNQPSSVETATREILFPVDLDPTSGTAALQSVQIQGRVDYHGHQVSDPAIRAELMEISFATGQTVNVTSGDRNSVPRGGAKNSEHLKGHAADFHIGGTTDSAAFAKIGGNHLLPNGFKLIQHGQFTITEGPHLHLDTSPGRGAPSRYVTEGLTPQTQGIYTVVQP